MDIPKELLKNLFDSVLYELVELREANQEEILQTSNKLLNNEEFIIKIIDEIFYEGVATLYTLKAETKEE
jgi:hypothetical protein